MRLVLSVLGFLLLAPVTWAQTRAIVDDAEALRWRAVGVVVINRQPICTGTLIAPDLVLTAAHCVYSVSGRKLFSPDLIEFRAGWRNGVSVARRQAVRITAHRNYDPTTEYPVLTKTAERNFAADIAVIELDTPVLADQAAPMPLLNRIRKGDKFDLVSYGQGRMDHPSIQAGCRLLGRGGGQFRGGMTYGRRTHNDMVRLSCEAVPGMSGAPVFGYVLGRPQIVSLVSGTLVHANGYRTAMGVALDKTLVKLMADRDAISSLITLTPPFWDSGSARRAGPQAPPPKRRIVRPGGALNLPQN